MLTPVLALGVLASHRDDPQYVAFAFVALGVCGCAYFAAKAWAKVSSSDPPPESLPILAGGFVLGALLLAGGMSVLAWLDTPLVAVRVLASIIILLAGIFGAFMVAMAVAVGGNEVLGYGLGLAILVVMGWVLSLVLPAY